MSKPAVLAIRAISMERESRTVMEATTSPRASFSLTGFRKISLAAGLWLKMGTPDMRPTRLARTQGRGYARGRKRCQPHQGRSVIKYDTNFKSVKDHALAEEY